MSQAVKLETEANIFFKRSSELSDARRGADAAALFEAKDEMEVMQMHARHPAIRARAARALANL